MEEHGLLEDFVVGNRDLERLGKLLAEFNFFDAIGAVRQELGHSDFLVFLLDPRVNHHRAQLAGKGWGPRERMLTFRFYNDVDQVHLRFLIDSGPQQVREALFRQWQQNKQVFNLGRGQAGRTEKTIYQRRYILHPDDYEDPDLELMKMEISKW